MIAFGTSLPVLASTSFTEWVLALPLMTILPSSVTVIGLEPTVNFIPSQPLKSLRGIPRVTLVTKGLGAGDPLWVTKTATPLEIVDAPRLSVALAAIV